MGAASGWLTVVVMAVGGILALSHLGVGVTQTIGGGIHLIERILGSPLSL